MKNILQVFVILHSFLCIAQSEKPKLVVGIVVDQMRYDYLTRFYDRFGEDGFKRLMKDGFNCKNHHFNYMPTYTGPGHASIFTGTTPENHGIIANNWYDKYARTTVYCVGDSLVKPLGTKSALEKMSPRKLLTTTFADANKIHTQFKGKTIGISIKDRGAVLPAGHSADFAFWFRGKSEGSWVSTNYYADLLPDWVSKYNLSQSVEKYMTTWAPLYPINTYAASGPDANNYERGFNGKVTAAFPYNLKALAQANAGYDILKFTPYGNGLVTDFAIEALKNENLGKDNITDVLTVSYSSTDYVGHNFGVNSVETEDTYLRLDKDLARLLTALDAQVGNANYSLFLTADHGAGHVPQFLRDNKIPGYYFDKIEYSKKLENFLLKTYKTSGLIANLSNQQVFFNYKKLADAKIDLIEISERVKQFLIQLPQMQHVFTRHVLENRNMTDPLALLVQNGFHQRLSGDVAFVLTPETINYGKKGSTHGSPQSYDTHVPLLFYGKGINKGKTFERTHVVDIAPTICGLLDIAAPNAATGAIIVPVLK